MLVAGIAVRHLGEVKLQVEGPFRCRGELVFQRRLRDPLPHDAIADDILLDGARVIGVAVALEKVVGGFLVVDS